MNKRLLLVGTSKFGNEIKPLARGIALEISLISHNELSSQKFYRKDADLIIVERDSSISLTTWTKLLQVLKTSKIKYIVYSSRKAKEEIDLATQAGATDVMLKPISHGEFKLRLEALFNSKNRISCLGGGTGLFNLLRGLKDLDDVLLTSIVSTSDDGASSGRLKTMFGILPPGDIRRSLVALSTAPQLMNDVMQYRFQSGRGLRGHSFGNLFLTALTNIKGNMSDAVRGLGDLLNINGVVFPIATTNTTLCAKFENGKIVCGESKIDLCKGRKGNLKIIRCWHDPKPVCDINAYAAILNSDFVTIGPGDLFTSVITNLLIEDVRKAVVKTSAKKIYICNLMTKPGETYGYTATDHVKEILKYLKEDALDYVIIPNMKHLSRKAAEQYAKKGQYPVVDGEMAILRKLTKAKIIMANVAHQIELVRHDAQKISGEIEKIIKSQKPERKKHG